MADRAPPGVSDPLTCGNPLATVGSPYPLMHPENSGRCRKRGGTPIKLWTGRNDVGDKEDDEDGDDSEIKGDDTVCEVMARDIPDGAC